MTSWHIHTFSSYRWERRLQLVTSRWHKQVSTPHPPRLYQRVSLWRRFWKVGQRRRVPGASLAEEELQRKSSAASYYYYFAFRQLTAYRTDAHTQAGLWILKTPFQTRQFVFYSMFHTCCDFSFRVTRYSIERSSDPDKFFYIEITSGSLMTVRWLDREEIGWHNITVLAMEMSTSRTISSNQYISVP